MLRDHSTPQVVRNRVRPCFPKRAVVTAGMPYGNKDLHFGHMGGVFVPADAFARFLRDRIGRQNVMFVSGTDCYGSPIVADHTRLIAEKKFSENLEEFVAHHHTQQIDSLKRYAIDLDCFGASALKPYEEFHRYMGKLITESLYQNGHLEQRTTIQWFDVELQIFLNGRQVLGHCPLKGCKSENAYADECSLGHQYEPRELVNPMSVLSGTLPEMREVTNWYCNLEKFKNTLDPWLHRKLETGEWREFAVRTVLEYLEPPKIHVKQEFLHDADDILLSLPPHRRESGKGPSDTLIFNSMDELDCAKTVLANHKISYRIGKTLVPFRFTGNLDLWLPAPEIEGLAGSTFWVWPESLWAPISFTAAHLNQKGQSAEDWKKWWCSTEAKVYQFIGEDNLFFGSSPK